MPVLFYILSSFNFTKFYMHSWKIFKVSKKPHPVEGKLNLDEMKCWSGKCADRKDNNIMNLCFICIMFNCDQFFLLSTAFYPL